MYRETSMLRALLSATIGCLLFSTAIPAQSGSWQADSAIDCIAGFQPEWITAEDKVAKFDGTDGPRLSFDPGASITVPIDANWHAEVELGFSYHPSPGQPLQLVIYFLMDETTDNLVRLTVDEQQISHWASFDTNIEDGKSTLVLMRETTGCDSKQAENTRSTEETLLAETPGDQTDRPLKKQFRIEYCFGGIRIVDGQGRVCLANYILNREAPVRAIRLEIGAAPLQFESLAIRHDPRPTYSPKETQDLARAEELVEEVFRLFEGGKLQEALGPANESLVLREQVLGAGDPSVAVTMNNVGFFLDALGDHEKARERFRRAQNIWVQSIGAEHQLVGESLNNLAASFQRDGYYDEAEPLLKRALDIFNQVYGTDNPSYARTLGNLAKLYQSQGRYDESLPLMEESAAIRKRVLGDDSLPYANSLNTLADSYQLMGDFDKAERALEAALQIVRREHGEGSLPHITLLLSLSECFNKANQLDESLALAQTAYDHSAQSLGEFHPISLQCLEKIAKLLIKLGKTDQALDQLASQTEAIQELGDSVSKEAKQSLFSSYAGALFYARDYDRAIQIYLENNDEDDSWISSSISRQASRFEFLGSAYQASGQFKSALENFERLFELRLQTAQSLLPTLSASEIEGWLDEFEFGVDSLLSLRCPALQEDRTTAIAINDQKAYEYVWQVKQLGPRLRVLASSVSDAGLARELASLRQELANLVTRSSVTNSETPIDPADTLQRIARLTEKKEALERDLARQSPVEGVRLKMKQATLSDLAKNLPPDVAVIDFFRRREVFPNPQSENTSKPSPRTQPLMAHFVYDAFVIRRSAQDDDTVVWIPLGDASQIDQAIDSWRKIVLDGDGTRGLASRSKRVKVIPDDLAPPTIERLVWKPIEHLVKDCRTLVFIPDGELHRFPFAAIAGDSPGEYLIDRYDIATADSAPALTVALSHPLEGLNSAGSDKSNQVATLVGNVDYSNRVMKDEAVLAMDERASSAADKATPKATANQGRGGQQWAPLPGTKRELDAIHEVLSPTHNVQRLDSGNATENAFTNAVERSTIVHVASHGFFERGDNIYRINLRQSKLVESRIAGKRGTVAKRNPLLLTGIVFAGANLGAVKDERGVETAVDGYLTAEEILQIDLTKTELAVLSACDTGLGEIAGGAGLQGLRSALHRAGARRVVASLWEVPDEATADLMVGFYRRLQEGELGYVGALAATQRELRQKAGDDLRAWAGFQISGDCR